MVAATVVFARVFLVGNIFGLPRLLGDNTLWFTTLALMGVAAAGYIINDYYDVKIDTVNRPGRVIVGKYVKRREALAMHLTLSAVSILVGALAGLKVGAVVVVLTFLLWLYSNYLKRTAFWGNLTVAVVTSSSVWILLIPYTSGQRLVIIYAVFALFITLVRELAKDMEDMPGDGHHGCRTLPIVLGLRPTKNILYLIIAIFLGTVYLVGYSISDLELSIYFALLTGLMVALSIMIYHADTIKAYHRVSFACKMIMVTGILSMAVV